jgi:hypothetical protein
VEEQALAVPRKLAGQLRSYGIACITLSEGFPQDMAKRPGRMFTISIIGLFILLCGYFYVQLLA